jgi:hypothetical protein
MSWVPWRWNIYCQAVVILRMIAVISRLAEIDRVTCIYLRFRELAADDLRRSPSLSLQADQTG